MAEYIEREALLKHYRALANIDWNNKVSPPSWSYAYESFIDHLEELPTADVVPKSEVEKIIEETFKRLRENFVISPLCKSALSDLEADLKKKYTEG